MPRSILTTVITNPQTFSLLLKITDELVCSNLLDSLRIVDQTDDDAATSFLRSMIPYDGETGSVIVTLDRDIVNSVDPRAHILMGMTGYHYKSTGVKLEPGGPSVNVITRGALGSFIAVSPTGKTGGVEVGLERNRCYIRTGRGGGSPITSLNVSGVVANGFAWRAIEVWIDIDKNINVKLDTGAVMTVPMNSEFTEFFVSVTSPPNGLSDFIVTRLDHREFAPKSNVDRRYISYYSRMPDVMKDVVEIRSELDIVYIEKNGWKKIINGSAIPLVWCEQENFSVFKRLGVLKESETVKDAHLGFFGRSRSVVDRIKALGEQDIPVVVPEKTKIRVVGSTLLAPPGLVCALDRDNSKNQQILEGYEKLFIEDLQGEGVVSQASDVLAYLDLLLNSNSADDFLNEIVEALPKAKRETLFKILNARLS